MTVVCNALGQPIGRPLPDWTPPPFPPHESLNGRFCRLEPLQPARHGDALWAAYADDTEGRMWTYLPAGPFAERAVFDTWLADCAAGSDPQFYAICDAGSGAALGLASYLRITPAMGSIEVGWLAYSPRLQRTPLTTEAMYLLMQRAFALGYRRYEWKCDALNAPSRAAAERLGFSYEGLFRQAVIYKQRNRDTAWYAVLDTEWPALRLAFETWLAPANFDAEGRQRQRLQACRSLPRSAPIDE